MEKRPEPNQYSRKEKLNARLWYPAAQDTLQDTP